LEPSLLSSQTLSVGEVELDVQSGELRRNGQKTRLADQPLQILLFLLAHRDRVVTREELREQLWPADTFVDFDRGLNSAIKKLRDALGDSAEKPTYIETLPRRGYRLVAPIHAKSAAEPNPSEAVPQTGHRPRLIWVGGAVAVIALSLIAAAHLQEPQTYRIRSIAVLPLANLSADRDQEYFADGMTEALITDLAQLQNVRVISRTSVMPYKETSKALPQIARELKVDGVVEGSVLRSGGRVRVTAQLIHAATDQHLWARSYERDLSDIVTLQRELSASISGAIHSELTPEARPRLQTAQPVNPEAYEFFLKGTAAFGRGTTQGMTDAIAYFQQAIAKQPDFALAYVSISRTYSQLAWSGSVAPQESGEKARAAALKAVALDPTLAEAHTELGRVLYQYDWNWAGSEREIRRALELNPNDAGAHRCYAALLRTTGRIQEAMAESRRVHELDPLVSKTSVGILGSGGGSRSRGEYERAITEMQRAVKMDPSLPRGHFQLGWTLTEAGRLDEGIKELENAVQLSTDNLRFRARLGWAYALAGRQQEARTILTELRNRSQKEFVSPTAIALVHLGLNETSQALQLLEQAWQQRDFELISLYNSTAFRPLRSEPRFRELMRRIGLPEA